MHGSVSRALSASFGLSRSLSVCLGLCWSVCIGLPRSVVLPSISVCIWVCVGVFRSVSVCVGLSRSVGLGLSQLVSIRIGLSQSVKLDHPAQKVKNVFDKSSVSTKDYQKHKRKCEHLQETDGRLDWGTGSHAQAPLWCDTKEHQPSPTSLSHPPVAWCDE